MFKIDEGDKTGVKTIVFIGNQNISNWRLKSLMQTTEMNFLSFFKTSDVYNPDMLANDEEPIRKYYMRYGYADFRITNTAVVYDPAQKAYLVTISLDEGPQYHVSSVTWLRTLPRVSGDELCNYVTQHPGDVYNATAVDKSVEAMTRDLARRGYAFSDVRPHGERDNANHTIALAFTVDDAPKVYVERIDIVGNTRTRDYVIRREFDIGEGDPYNHALIERGERRLNNLDFFKSVHVSTRPGSAPDRIIITVAVEDKPTGSISLSGGYSTLEGPLAEVAFTETNFLGRGQYVRLSASEGHSQQRLGRQLHRALSVRPAARGRLRHLPQAAVAEHLRALSDQHDGHEPAPRRADHRGADVPAELLAVRVADRHPEQQLAALRRLRQSAFAGQSSRGSTAGNFTPGGSTVSQVATPRTTA